MSRRIRLLVSRGEECKYLSHLDVCRVWERACRRAGIKLKYSEGFSPHPKLTIAAPLPVGVTACADFLEIECDAMVRTVMQTLPSALPIGFEVHDAMEIDPAVESLQSLVHRAQYKVVVEYSGSVEQVEEKLRIFLEASEVLITRHREDRSKEINIRPLVLEARLENLENSRLTLILLLMCSAEGTGRCDEFCSALGLSAPLETCRTRLFLKE